MSKLTIPIPKFSSDKPYDRYKSEIEAWTEATDAEKKKHGLLVALSLPEDDVSQIRDKVFAEIEIAKLKADDGLKTLTSYLDSQFAKDDLTETYERYVEFERCKRGANQKINDFILEYEKKHNALSKKKATYPEIILAMKLIDNSNLTVVDRKLVLSGMDYSKTADLFKQSKESLRKFIGEQSVGASASSTTAPAIKLETFITEHEEALVAAGWQRRGDLQNVRGRSNSLPNIRGGGRGRSQSPFRQERRQNPYGKDGYPKHCYKCYSTEHMIADCPRNVRYEYEIGLFTGNDKNELVLLLHETWNSAILDSACSSDVSGKKWIDELMMKLNLKEEQVSRGSSVKVFNFGGGEKLDSLGSVKFPCVIAGKEVMITTDVVDSNIPLLLSIRTMKEFGMIWDFRKGTVELFGKVVELDVSMCGHHSIPIMPSEVTIAECALVAKDVDIRDEEYLKRKLKFLHMTFAHPPRDKFINLLRNANVWSDKFSEPLDKIYARCETCAVFSKTPSRPVVAMPEAQDFGELVVMDLKVWKTGYILHMIDAFSRFSISVAIKNKAPQTVGHHFLVNWVGAGYGLCKKVKFDNGGEFSNEEMRELSDCLGIEVETTAAKSPWQNGLCERNHAVVDRCLEKILDENPELPLEVALAYACNAKNSLQMWNGYSSYQIVFGSNPKVPDMFHATLPQLEGKTQSELVVQHLNAQQSARRGFTESQCDEKIRRALRHQVRCHLEVYNTGDKVYFKRDDSNRWRGPGTVIGQDRQVVFVRHGGVFIRVPTCRLKKVHSAEDDEQIDSQLPVVDQQSQTNEKVQEDEEEIEIHADTQDESSNEGAVSSENIKLKQGDHIRFRKENDDEWHAAEVISAAGKKTSNNRNWYNLKEGEMKYSMDMARVRDLKVEKQVETVNVVMVPRIDHGKSEIVQAKNKELDMWKKMGVFEEVPDIGQSRIQTNWVVTEKTEGYKARLVVRGDQENCNVQGDSPTISKLAIRIFLSLAAAEGFKISSKDVRSAFLQGKDLERTVYVEPPSEMKKPFKIWKLKKAAYGLGDAARNWYESVLQEMIKIGCQKSIYENALFYFKESGQLRGLTATHVDDFMYCGDETYNGAVTQKINRTSRHEWTSRF